jgi:UDP-glucose 4-epimerase|tara:strand:+ start:167 stop:1054 length:888 start_codon:yes stop_codon:yes gene_type:complete
MHKLMGRTLITGGAGFIGSHLCEQLQKLGEEIIIFDNFSTGKAENLFSLKPTPLVVIYEVGTVMWGNLPDIKFDTLIHLAAPVSVEESLNNKEKYHDQIVDGSAFLFDWAIQCGCKEIVVASTAAVYGNSKSFPLSEDSELDPLNPYATSKYMMEVLCKAVPDDVSVAVLRFFNVFGERQLNEGGYLSAVPIFLNQFKNNLELTVTGDGQQTRDFVYVKDVVDAIIASIGTKGTWNVGSGKEVKIINIAKAFSDNIKFIPARKEAKRSLSNISKIKEDLGWTPQVSLINWIKSIK